MSYDSSRFLGKPEIEKIKNIMGFLDMRKRINNR